MNHKIPITLLMAILFGYSVAQNQVTIKGRVTDKNGHGIEYAAIQIGNSGAGVITDARGFYSIKATTPANISVFALGYTNQQKQVEASPGSSIELNFTLERDATQLKEVTVSANNPSGLITEAPNLMSFELKDKKLWLVFSEKKSDKIKIIDTAGNSITQTTLPYRFQKDSINLTPHNFLYTIHNDSIQLYKLRRDSIAINKMSLATYEKYSNNLVAYRYPYYYYLSYDSLDTRVNYSYFNKADSSRKIFYRFRDSRLMRSNRETKELMLALEGLMAQPGSSTATGDIYNYKDTLIAMLGYLPSPADLKELILQMYRPQGATLMEVNDIMDEAEQIINTPGDPYAAVIEQERLANFTIRVISILKVIKDSVYIFNFDNNTITVYSPNNVYERTETFEVNIHSINYRNKEILVDQVTQECYFKYWKNLHTYLAKIDLATGRVLYTIELNYMHLGKIRIAGGYAYFSGEGTNGSTCIFSQRLN
jgi:hypothetical protein